MGLNRFLFNAKAKGLPIDVVYDIGAFRGQWSMDLKYNVLQNSRFYLFEGNKECEESLKEKKLMYFMDVLADPGRGEVDFYNGTNTGDSYYQETTKIYEGFQPIRVPTITLDELIDKHNLPIPDFIKLDTQGSELDILKGASKIMGKTPLIFTEMPIIEYNKGAPKFSDYMDFFKAHDYIPVDIFDMHRAEETLMQVDIMFMLREAKYRILGANDVIRV